jgi:hypothetical protein
MQVFSLLEKPSGVSSSLCQVEGKKTKARKKKWIRRLQESQDEREKSVPQSRNLFESELCPKPPVLLLLLLAPPTLLPTPPHTKCTPSYLVFRVAFRVKKAKLWVRHMLRMKKMRLCPAVWRVPVRFLLRLDHPFQKGDFPPLEQPARLPLKGGSRVKGGSRSRSRSRCRSLIQVAIRSTQQQFIPPSPPH